MEAVFPIILLIGLTGYAVLLGRITKARLALRGKLRGFSDIAMNGWFLFTLLLCGLFVLTITRQLLHLPPMSYPGRWALGIIFLAAPWYSLVCWELWERGGIGKD